MEYQELLQDIGRRAVLAGQNPNEITLLPVTKTHPWERIAPLYEAGCRQFGESRLQEALPKMEQAPNDIEWHFIGTLQSNKVRKALGRFALIHSVDSQALAEQISEVSQEMRIKSSILLQVNTSKEAAKHGLTIEEWRSCIKEVFALPGISIQGLMTIGPLVGDEEQIRHCFASLRNFRDEIQESMLVILPHLSMGMTHDYPIAIEEGATILRIGTLLFGERE